MCGFTGLIAPTVSSTDDLRNILTRMNAFIESRGPDDEGLYVEQEKKLALGFRRLAIQDLSPLGAQPMSSQTGRYVIAFNGEIYNFQMLRSDLQGQGIQFKGHSDTEVMLAAFERWGVEEVLQKIEGMFAFALFDKQENALYLARDRMGKKPLYYGVHEGRLYFASEMKSILAACKSKPSVNKDVAALYFQWRYVPEPYCIYAGFHKLTPGHVLRINIDKPLDLQEAKAFWSLEKVIDARKIRQEADSLEALQNIIRQATAKRMIADVELGAFLSGGIDSSLITALMHEQSDKKIKTFTIAFDDPKYNEAEHARQIAAHLGTDHHEMTVCEKDALECIEKLPNIFDEPFADPSAIPSYLVCKLARQHMTVALSGDGGDESFGGYSWYSRMQKLMALPFPARKLFGKTLSLSASPQHKKIASILLGKDTASRYSAIHSYWQSVSPSLLAYKPQTLELPMDVDLKNLSDHERMMAYDELMFLPSDVLTKVDRTSMAVSLEVRSPLLDQHVVEYAWSLPDSQRIGKSLLKELAYQYIPRELLDRPKQGFSIPHQRWLREGLRDWGQALIENDEGFLDHARVQKIWYDHQQGKADYGHLLWTILQFKSWHRTWIA
ncbi:MAG: asparagine synthase (glutamine-hydrolyzing) [Micavibrio sp.]|nr:asparagine synthase (glutamine-hydrolyzing) [Micavibrio sp.]